MVTAALTPHLSVTLPVATPSAASAVPAMSMSAPASATASMLAFVALLLRVVPPAAFMLDLASMISAAAAMFGIRLG